jgi:hypothetical protein
MGRKSVVELSFVIEVISLFKNSILYFDDSQTSTTLSIFLL